MADCEVDRLSSLPDDLIYKILSYIDIVYSIRLSVVSSRWRFIWTSLPTLNFLSDEICNIPLPYHEFVNNVLSARNNKIDVSSVSLRIADTPSLSNLRILEYEFSHNLTTLHLRKVLFDNCSSNLAMCQNLKNLTLERCQAWEEDSPRFTITNSRLLSLTIKKVDWFVDFVYVGTPQLKNLIFVDSPHVGRRVGELTMFAPELTYLRIKGFDFPKLSLDGFLSLEKVDLCISSPQKTDVHKIRDLFQRLHSVKSLAVSMEIVKLLSTSEEVISHQPSPFPSLKSLKIYPSRSLKTLDIQSLRTYKLKSILEMFPTQMDEEQSSAEVANYLLGSSSNSTFTMVSCEEARAIKITTASYHLMAALWEILEEMEAYTETERANVESKTTLADSCLEDFKMLISPIDDPFVIFCMLQNIKLLLTEVLASERVEMQSCFSRLSAKSKTVVNNMVETSFDAINAI